MSNHNISYTKISQTTFEKLLPKNPNFFLKGIKKDFQVSTYMMIDTLETERPTRESKKNYHFYDLMLNNLDSWSNYPRRNKSIIGTNSLTTAKSYAHRTAGGLDGVLAVVPIKNEPYCICPNYDLLFSFRRLDPEFKSGNDPILIQLNFEIVSSLKLQGLEDEKIRGLDYTNLMIWLNQINQDTINDKSKILKHFLASKKSAENYFSEFLDPSVNKFEISSKKIEISNNCQGNEIFASGKFLLLPYELLVID